MVSLVKTGAEIVNFCLLLFHCHQPLSCIYHIQGHQQLNQFYSTSLQFYQFDDFNPLITPIEGTEQLYFKYYDHHVINTEEELN